MKFFSNEYFFWTLIALFSLVIIQLVLLKGWEIKPLLDERVLNWAFRILLFFKIGYFINALILQYRLKKSTPLDKL